MKIETLPLSSKKPSSLEPCSERITPDITLLILYLNILTRSNWWGNLFNIFVLFQNNLVTVNTEQILELIDNSSNLQTCERAIDESTQLAMNAHDNGTWR